MILLNRHLKQLQKKLSPQSHFKRSLWKQLDAKWDTEALPAYEWYQTMRFRAASVALCAVGALATVTTSAYAYTSTDVAVGTPLYRVKQTIETVEKSLQVTPRAKAAFLLKQMKRREAEKQVLERKQINLEKADTAISEVADELKKIDDEKIKISSSTTDRVLHERIQRKLERREEQLEKQKERLENRKERIESRAEKKSQKLEESSNDKRERSNERASPSSRDKKEHDDD